MSCNYFKNINILSGLAGRPWWLFSCLSFGVLDLSRAFLSKNSRLLILSLSGLWNFEIVLTGVVMSEVDLWVYSTLCVTTHRKRVVRKRDTFYGAVCRI